MARPTSTLIAASILALLALVGVAMAIGPLDRQLTVLDQQLSVLEAAQAIPVVGLAQQPVEPPEYPEGVACSPQGKMYGSLVVDPNMPCHCKRMFIPDAGDDRGANGDPDCCNSQQHSLDATCSQYCHEDHCKCPIACPKSTPEK